MHAGLGVLASPLRPLAIDGRLGVTRVVLHVVVWSVRRVLLLVRVGWARGGGN